MTGLAALALLFLPALLFAQPLDDSPSAVHFREKVDRLFERQCAKGSRAGVKIVSLQSGQVLFEKNNSELFVPASNMKVVTTAAALRKVGPDYRFPTRVYATGPVEKRKLKGDLYVKGFGDPFLVTEQMWLLVNEIKNLPLDAVEGDLVLDDSYFGGGRKVATWKGQSGPEAYLAPLGALSLNFNTVAVHVAPGKREGNAPVVIVDPATPFHKVENSAVTKARGRRGRLVVNRHHKDGRDVISVSGSLPQSVGRKTYYLNVTRPLEYAGEALKKMLGQAGVNVTGKVLPGQVPEDAVLLHEHDSLPFSDILQGLDKYSNNFIAEQILRTLSAREFGPPGTTESGARLLTDYMKSLGFSETGFSIVDGSGLSRQNRLSPDHMVAVLKDAHGDWSIFPEFVSALAIMGLDGSVNERMTKHPESRKIRTKTGTLNRVSSLSGFFQSRDGEVFAFSILMNGLKCSNGRAHRLQNAIMTEALAFSRREGNALADSNSGFPGLK